MYNVIFNKVIMYDPDEGTLYHIDNPNNVVKLYYSANKCLQVLIAHNPTPVMQRFFLEEVWERKGQSATANTFYQCVSSIRKAFASLSLDEDIIKTIPRKGIQLSPEVSIEFMQPNISVEQKLPSRVQYDLTRFIFPVIVIVILVALVYLFVINTSFSKGDYDLEKLYDKSSVYKNCHIYRGVGNKTSMEIISSVISEEQLNCNEEANVYFTSTEHPSRESIIYCPVDKKHGCQSIYRIK